jgi:hypothetical protein
VIRALLEAARLAALVRKKFRADPASVPLGATYMLYITPRAHIGTLFRRVNAVHDDSELTWDGDLGLSRPNAVRKLEAPSPKRTVLPCTRQKCVRSFEQETLCQCDHQIFEMQPIRSTSPD